MAKRKDKGISPHLAGMPTIDDDILYDLAAGVPLTPFDRIRYEAQVESAAAAIKQRNMGAMKAGNVERPKNPTKKLGGLRIKAGQR